MSTPTPDKFVRLSRPAVPVVKLTAEHDADAPPVSTGEWVRLARPAMPVVKLMAEPEKGQPDESRARVQDWLAG